jgi:hypothetical protein
MAKRILVSLASLAVTAAAVGPPAADAVFTAPHWIVGGQVIRNEKHVVVANLGGHKLTFEITKTGAAVTCTISLRDTITNPLDESAGVDQMTAFQPAKCAQKVGPRLCPHGHVGIVALGLPWPSHLALPRPEGAEANNLLEGVGLEFRCNEAKVAGPFKGVLNAVVNQLPGRPGCGGLNPHPCAQFEFRKEASLSGEGGNVAVSGVARIAGLTEPGNAPKIEIQVCECNQRGK